MFRKIEKRSLCSVWTLAKGTPATAMRNEPFQRLECCSHWRKMMPTQHKFKVICFQQTWKLTTYFISFGFHSHPSPKDLIAYCIVAIQKLWEGLKQSFSIIQLELSILNKILVRINSRQANY